MRKSRLISLGTAAIVLMGLMMTAAQAQEFNPTISVPVTIYDFHSDRSNPEFEQPHNQRAQGAIAVPNQIRPSGHPNAGQTYTAYLRPGMVANTLDADNKPMLSGEGHLNHGIRFWFRDWSDLSSYKMASQPDPVNTSRGYLEKFRPVYKYRRNNSNPAVYDILPPARTAPSNQAAGGEYTAEVRHIVNAYDIAELTAQGITTNNSIDSAFENRVIPYSLVFTLIDPVSGIYQFDRQEFFPINNSGFGNEWNVEGVSGRNYSYTMEMHWPFTMDDGLTFNFRGDDDVWVFINGQLVMDIGGMHEPITSGFNLDDLREALSLSNGQQCTLSMFYSERHTTGSSILITTNLNKGDPCVTTPTLGCPGYCDAYPTDPGCIVTPPPPPPDPCVTSPTPDCPGYCDAYPTDPGCIVTPPPPPPDPCVTTPTLGCPGYCDAYPTDPGCIVTPPPPPPDPCVTSPTPDCPGYCDAYPTDPGCIVTPPPPLFDTSVISGGFTFVDGSVIGIRVEFNVNVSVDWFEKIDIAFGLVTGSATDMSCLIIDPNDAKTAVLDFTCAFPGANVPQALAANSHITIYFSPPRVWDPHTINIVNGIVGVLTSDRVIPQVMPDEGAAVIMPISSVGFKFTVGPNPVSKSIGVVGFFINAPMSKCSGTLMVYDVMGNIVRKININSVGATVPGRPLATWDLRDGRGRVVTSGTYLVRGTITVNGKRERVSAAVGVR